MKTICCVFHCSVFFLRRHWFLCVCEKQMEFFFWSMEDIEYVHRKMQTILFYSWMCPHIFSSVQRNFFFFIHFANSPEQIDGCLFDSKTCWTFLFTYIWTTKFSKNIEQKLVNLLQKINVSKKKAPSEFKLLIYICIIFFRQYLQTTMFEACSGK